MGQRHAPRGGRADRGGARRPFFSLLPRWLARRIAAAAGVYVSAAAGLEMVESGIFAARGGKDWTAVLQVLVGIEEGLEMGAAAIMLLALLRHLAIQAPDWRLRVAPADPATQPGRVADVTLSLSPVGSRMARMDASAVGGPRGPR